AEGRTPLFSAAAQDNSRFAEMLVKAGADMEAEFHGLTVLMMAAGQGKTEMIKLLIHLGAHVNHPSSLTGQTALISACASGSTDSVSALIESKADVNQRMKSGESPLKAAREANQAQIVEMLKAAGAKE